MLGASDFKSELRRNFPAMQAQVEAWGEGSGSQESYVELTGIRVKQSECCRINLVTLGARRYLCAGS